MRDTHCQIRKKPHTVCAVCAAIEGYMGWRVDSWQAVLHGDGPPTAAEVRRERDRFEQEILANRPGARRAWLNFLLESHPELRAPIGRPAVPISGLILYVLAATVARFLGHTATLASGERNTHFLAGSLVGEIARLGREAVTARRRT